jgi:hypothetical protein
LLEETALRLSKLQSPLITRCRKIIDANETLKKKRPDPQRRWTGRDSPIL